jgi:methionyl-tRNA formyltransferase
LKFVLLGTSRFAIRCAEAIRDGGGELAAVASLPLGLRPNNSADFGAFARQAGIPYVEIEDVNARADADSLRAFSPDYLFVSWPQMLKADALAVPRRFCIGTHPTDIPFNRGRHPLHWMIALGIPETKLSFFKLDEGVDTGNVLLKVSLPVRPADEIGTVTARMEDLGYQGTLKLLSMLREDPAWTGTPQVKGAGNIWRKRSPHDVTLDPRMTTGMIIRTVRSFAPPYPCANLIFGRQIIKIARAEAAPVAGQAQWSMLETGRVISVERQRIRMKVEDGVVDLYAKDPLPAEMSAGKCIHPPTKYLAAWHDHLAPLLEPK